MLSPDKPLRFSRTRLLCVACIPCLVLFAACSKSPEQKAEKPAPVTSAPKQAPSEPLFQVDSKTAGSITGTVQFQGRPPRPRPIDMSDDPACVEAHRGRPFDESVVVSRNGRLANVFLYVKSGLEGKHFPIPDSPVTIDQNGCWFKPRVLGIQVGQRLNVTNSDPVTHNIHPLAQINREWNHSQGAGDPPLARKFLKPEIMIRVKCNIHSWMHAYIGVTENPYYAVTGTDGTFNIPNLPPGQYVLEAWHEEFGTQDLPVTVKPSSPSDLKLTFKNAQK